MQRSKGMSGSEKFRTRSGSAIGYDYLVFVFEAFDRQPLVLTIDREQNAAHELFNCPITNDWEDCAILDFRFLDWGDCAIFDWEIGRLGRLEDRAILRSGDWVI
ncbi:MAG: hypothetical protein HC942_27955 [Microcoleus sp. SU_5_6]|nr:hypothetical protein [Microcoleus sp. SU_5_6]